MKKYLLRIVFSWLILAVLLIPLGCRQAAGVGVPPVPNSAVTISPSSFSVNSGSTVSLTVTEKNTGNVDLTNISVNVTGGAIFTLSKNGPNPAGTTFSGDSNNDSILNSSPAETWTWFIPNVIVNSSTSFTATGHGTWMHTYEFVKGASYDDITSPLYPSEQQTVSVAAILAPGNLQILKFNDLNEMVSRIMLNRCFPAGSSLSTALTVTPETGLLTAMV